MTSQESAFPSHPQEPGQEQPGGGAVPPPLRPTVPAQRAAEPSGLPGTELVAGAPAPQGWPQPVRPGEGPVPVPPGPPPGSPPGAGLQPRPEPEPQHQHQPYQQGRQQQQDQRHQPHQGQGQAPPQPQPHPQPQQAQFQQYQQFQEYQQYLQYQQYQYQQQYHVPLPPQGWAQPPAQLMPPPGAPLVPVPGPVPVPPGASAPPPPPFPVPAPVPVQGQQQGVDGERAETAAEQCAGQEAERPSEPEEPLDVVGVGIGPFNLSLAALGHGVPRLRMALYDRRSDFRWHPGLLIEGATLQVPFLADLVSLADPASPWSFLSYLRAQDRLFPFYFAERFHIERAEYDAYCRWVSEGLAAAGEPGEGPGLHFGHQVDACRWNAERGAFEVDFTQLGPNGEAEALGRTYARNLVLGVGTEPYVPEPLRPLTESPAAPVLHSADYLSRRAELLAAEHVTVVGSGQSGAEVFLDLLRNRPAGREGLHWLTRSAAFAPMEYSKLGLEHFTPDYTRYFHSLPERVRDELLPKQWQLHKAVDHDTLAAIHDELYRRTLNGGWPDAVLTPGVTVRTAGRIGATKLELHLEHDEQDERTRLMTDALVLATGYRERPLDGVLAGLSPYIRRDGSERPRIDDQYRLVLDPSITGSVYVQNAERHSHGVGAPDLGMAAHRSAVILNSVTGEERFRLPERTAFTSFGLRSADRQGAAAPAGRLGIRPLRAM